MNLHSLQPSRGYFILTRRNLTTQPLFTQHILARPFSQKADKPGKETTEEKEAKEGEKTDEKQKPTEDK